MGERIPLHPNCWRNKNIVSCEITPAPVLPDAPITPRPQVRQTRASSAPAAAAAPITPARPAPGSAPYTLADLGGVNLEGGRKTTKPTKRKTTKRKTAKRKSARRGRKVARKTKKYRR